MRFLCDMGISLHVHEMLRQAGHDSLHLREEGLQRMADLQIIEKARYENRIVLTHDLDFGRLLALSGDSTPSVVTFRLSDMRPQSVLEGLSVVLAEYRDLIVIGAAAVVGDRGVRCRQLPITRGGE